MIEGVLNVSEMTVRDVMIPRSQMDCVSIDDEPEAFIPMVIETKHSRFPVIGESKDDVVGILLAKELLNYYRNPEGFSLRDTLRPAVFVPESKRLNVLLREFRSNRNHIAIVVDEYGGVSGLVTIEDVLEQIVGDIEDEYDFDETEDNIIAEGAGRFRVKAQTEIADFNGRFGSHLSDDAVDTVGGPGRARVRPAAQARRQRHDRRVPVPRRARGQPPHPHAAGREDRAAGRRRRRPEPSLRARAALAALAGALTVFGYAPFGVALAPIATLAVLFGLWRDAPTPRAAAVTGFAFGAGLFGAGVSWIAIALERFGGMPAPLAILGIAGFCAYLALWPALAGWAVARVAPAASAARLVAAAGAWTLAEWLRGFVLSGFPWLAVGHAELPGSSLAGYAPVGGVFAVSLAVAVCAALLAWLVDAIGRGARAEALGAAGTIAAIFVAGAALDGVEWTRPHAAPVAVSLVQGNIAQEEKFDPELRERAFRIYAELVATAKGTIVVLPESAFPVFAHQVPAGDDRVARRDDAAAPGRRAARRVRRAPARRRRDAAAHPQQRRLARRVADAALPQASPRAVRRDDPREGSGRLGDRALARDPAVRPDARARPTSRRSRSPASARGPHLLRGRVRQRARVVVARRDDARQRDQRRVVRPLDRRVAAQPDRRDAREGERQADAPRDQHRRHQRDRRRRRRSRAAAVVPPRRARDDRRGRYRRDAVRPLRQPARRNRLARATRPRLRSRPGGPP
jgi:hypothetical protein